MGRRGTGRWNAAAGMSVGQRDNERFHAVVAKNHRGSDPEADWLRGTLGNQSGGILRSAAQSELQLRNCDQALFEHGTDDDKELS